MHRHEWKDNQQDLERSSRRYRSAWIITISAATLQLLVYIMSAQSLSLIGDTAHAYVDGSVLFGTYILVNYFRTHTYRYHAPGEKIFTYVNILLLIGGALYVGHEAIGRIGSPQAFPVIPVLVVAIIGAIMNLWALGILKTISFHHARTRLYRNHRANLAHMRQDLWLSIAVMLSACAMWLGFPRIDPFIGGAIALYIFWEGFGLLYEEATGKHFPFSFHHHEH